MKRSQIWIIVALMSIALLGLVSFQLYWINNALELNSQRFKSDVFESMKQVAFKLESQNVARQMKKFVEIRNDSMHFMIRERQTEGDSIRLDVGNWAAKPEPLMKMRVITEDSKGPAALVHRDTSYNRENNELLSKYEMVELVITQLEGENEFRRAPDKHTLDSLLHSEFVDKGIDIQFDYAVFSAEDDSIILSNAANEVPRAADFEYRTSLNPNDIFGNISYLALNFPSQEQFLFRQAWATLASSAVLLLIIISCFVYALYTIIRQKKLSEIKNDFINNMTHEFKTPVATISLANEALREPEVLNDRERIFRYLDIIRDENSRLGVQVEKVLQSATLDKGDYKLNMERVDIVNLVRSAVDNFKMKVRSVGGNMVFNSDDEHLSVKGDEHHLFNSVNNLLDNAIKYSTAAPDIRVDIVRGQGLVEVNVSDKGIGLSRDSLRKVFEKFYRVPTGDLHDVKGFGLGLSYVQAIVMLHGGKVTAYSSQGKGSTFSITLPEDE